MDLVLTRPDARAPELMRGGWQRAGREARLFSALFAVAMTGVVLVLAAADPSSTRFFPFCVLYRCTGLLCPGCGAARAMHALAHGDLAAALRLNPLLVVLGPPFAVWVALHAVRAATGWSLKVSGFPTAAMVAVAAVLVGFAVLRNLPWPVFDCLRPPTPERVCEPGPVLRLHLP